MTKMSKFDELIAGLNQIATALLSSSAQKSPDLFKDLSDYPDFDWSSIGAEVLARDEDGVTVVSWNGRKWKRRTHAQYGKDIWFSSCTGKNEKQENVYSKLITFGEPKLTDLDEVEPLPDKVRQALKRRPRVVPVVPPPVPPPVKRPQTATATSRTPQQLAVDAQAPLKVHPELAIKRELIAAIDQEYVRLKMAPSRIVQEETTEFQPQTWDKDCRMGASVEQLQKYLDRLRSYGPPERVVAPLNSSSFWPWARALRTANDHRLLSDEAIRVIVHRHTDAANKTNWQAAKAECEDVQREEAARYRAA